ncbi:MAG: methylenetetrahydrofolate--tRNA-(uracil(54)-C(5))-methyltransferase (FADH(2)-oxidizing) TrmFO [Myxococcota bacterium]
MKPVVIVGAGLAGSEAALQLAARGIPVRLHEMKPKKRTPAQVGDEYAELVCSNSFRSASLENAVGLIKEEMRRAGSFLMRFAEETKVPAGDALAVDRRRFGALVTGALRGHPNIEIVEEEVLALPGPEVSPDVVIATGPLTAPDLAQSIAEASGDASRLYFYDAIAPIVAASSVDNRVAFFASRYGKGNGDDYLNCPLDEAEYRAFIDAILAAEKVVPHAFEDERYFEGCLPIEVMASRGLDTLRYGPMKPVGLPDPRTGRPPWAVVQLRKEDVDGTAYNLVGFQTRMKWGEQQRIFRMIPGLGGAEFLRLGQIHRNTYLDAPALLDAELRLKARPHLVFAGQITGVEGYVESTASGLLAALMIAARRQELPFAPPPPTTALGALHGHTLGTRRAPNLKAEQHLPSNIHFGLFPALEGRLRKKDRKHAYSERALEDFEGWRAQHRALLLA